MADTGSIRSTRSSRSQIYLPENGGSAPAIHADDDDDFDLSVSGVTSGPCEVTPLDVDAYKKLDLRIQPREVIHKAVRNKKYNRYLDVLPNPETKVTLPPYGDPEQEAQTSYYNANYVRGASGNPRRFICSMGPLPAVVINFWRMIWQDKVPLILMATDIVEAGKKKCEQYWPEKEGQSVTHGDITVTSEKKIVTDNWTETKLKLQRGGETHSMTHLWFTSWPDHGVPVDASGNIDASGLVRFVLRSRRIAPNSTAPTLVHCSAGVGRAGTVIATHHCLELIDTQNRVDPIKVVERIRHDRVALVQHKEQFELVHAAVVQYAKMCNRELRIREESASGPNWLHGEYSKEEADDMLTKGVMPDGKFFVCIRDNLYTGRPNNDDDYVLCVAFKGHPTQHLISRNADGLMVVNNTPYGEFRTLHELIEGLGQAVKGWPVPLKHPVEAPVQEKTRIPGHDEDSDAEDDTPRTPAARRAAERMKPRPDWLHGTVSEDDVKQMLQPYAKEDGAFLVCRRDNLFNHRETGPDDYVLAVTFKGMVTQHLVTCREDGVFVVNNQQYGDPHSIEQVVERLRSPVQGWPVILKTHVPAGAEAPKESSATLQVPSVQQAQQQQQQAPKPEPEIKKKGSIRKEPSASKIKVTADETYTSVDQLPSPKGRAIWLHGHVSKEEADAVLARGGLPNGKFFVCRRLNLFKHRDVGPDDYVLVVAFQNMVTQHLITKNEDGAFAVNSVVYGTPPPRTVEQLIDTLGQPGVQGWPVRLVEPVPREDEQPKESPKKAAAAAAERPPWYHGSLSKEGADARLQAAGIADGRFFFCDRDKLYLDRANRPGDCVLVVGYMGMCTQHLVAREDNGAYTVNGQPYGNNQSLEELVDSLSKAGVPGWPVPLRDPVLAAEADKLDAEAASKAAADAEAAQKATAEAARKEAEAAAAAAAAAEAEKAKAAAEAAKPAETPKPAPAASNSGELQVPLPRSAPNFPPTPLPMWFHGKLTKEQAEEVLLRDGNEQGRFLVCLREDLFKNRPNGPYDCVICVVYRGRATQHVVSRSPMGVFNVNGKEYGKCQTIEQLIEVLSKSEVPGWPVPLGEFVTSDIAVAESKYWESRRLEEQRQAKESKPKKDKKLSFFGSKKKKDKKEEDPSALPPWMHDITSREEADAILTAGDKLDGKFFVCKRDNLYKTRPNGPDDCVLCVMFQGRPTQHVVSRGQDGLMQVNGVNYGNATSIQELVTTLSRVGIPNWPVPLQYVIPRPEEGQELPSPEAAKRPWLHGELSREEAHTVLVSSQDQSNGVFFVCERENLFNDRPNGPDDFVLCIVYNKLATQHVVTKNADGLMTVNGQVYGQAKDIDELIETLKKPNVPNWPVQLTTLIPKEKSAAITSAKKAVVALGSDKPAAPAESLGKSNKLADRFGGSKKQQQQDQTSVQTLTTLPTRPAWLQGYLSREEAHKILLDHKGDGRFFVCQRENLFRDRANGPDACVLCVNYLNQPTQHVVSRAPDGTMAVNARTYGPTFNLVELIEKLSKPGVPGWPVALVNPITGSYGTATPEEPKPEPAPAAAAAAAAPAAASAPAAAAVSAAAAPAQQQQPQMMDNMSGLPAWFHTALTEQQASDLLLKFGVQEGKFLVCPRAKANKKQTEQYLLWVIYRSRPECYELTKRKDGVVLVNGSAYGENKNVEDLIETLSRPGVPGWPVRLTIGVPVGGAAPTTTEMALRPSPVLRPSWYHGYLTKEESEVLVMGDRPQDGRWLVCMRQGLYKNQPNGPEDCVLVVVYKGYPTQHIITRWTDGNYAINNKAFGFNPSLPELIDQLKKPNPQFPAQLRDPVHRVLPEWFHGKLTRDQANELLMRGGATARDGRFLVCTQDAPSNASSMENQLVVLCVIAQGQPSQHVFNRGLDGTLRLDGTPFGNIRTLEEMVDLLEEHESWDKPLTEPVLVGEAPPKAQVRKGPPPKAGILGKIGELSHDEGAYLLSGDDSEEAELLASQAREVDALEVKERQLKTLVETTQEEVARLERELAQQSRAVFDAQERAQERMAMVEKEQAELRDKIFEQRLATIKGFLAFDTDDEQEAILKMSMAAPPGQASSSLASRFQSKASQGSFSGEPGKLEPAQVLAAAYAVSMFSVV